MSVENSEETGNVVEASTIPVTINPTCNEAGGSVSKKMRWTPPKCATLSSLDATHGKSSGIQEFTFGIGSPASYFGPS